MCRVRLVKRLLVIGVLTVLPLGAQEIVFDPEITQQEFEEFAATIGRGIYGSPIEPAEARSILSFDIGVAVTAMRIDEDAAFWIRSVDDDILQSGYLLVPRLIASKGLGRVNLSASYMQIPDTDVRVWGAALDVPIIRGGLVRPTIALRGTWSDLQGIEDLDLQTVGIEGFISKGFGPITPYAGIGLAQTEAEGLVRQTELTPEILLEMKEEETRLTVGARLSLLLFKLVVEAVRTDDTVYGAKFSFSL
jgi:hypothetical protein